jgi:3-mercaptopyruvate sulfurtransferase SseA
MRVKKRLGYLVLIAMFTLVSVGCGIVKKPGRMKATASKKWRFHDIVDVNVVRQYVKIPRPKGVLLIDSRPTRLKYDKGYIPTAINIPHSSFKKMVSLLPKDTSTLLIFYCQGPT